MKGGKTPIHVQRWCPADFHQDEHVSLLYARRDWTTLTFYRTFLDTAFMQGGDLPADPEMLSACVRMPSRDVRKALAFCLGRLLHEADGRIYQGRVRREVAHELAYRTEQAVLGRKGGLKAGRGRPHEPGRGTPNEPDRGAPTESIGPPAPTPIPLSPLRGSGPHTPLRGSGNTHPTDTPTPPPSEGMTAPHESVGSVVSEDAAVHMVFEYWREKTKATRAQWTPERRRSLLIRLREEPGDLQAKVAGLKLAVDGALQDPLFNGAEKGRSFLGFENLFVHKGRNRIEKLQAAARSEDLPVADSRPADIRSQTVGQVNLAAAKRLIGKLSGDQ